MNCDIIKDLLPLYCDGVCSEETSRAVEEHLTTCPVCRALLLLILATVTSANLPR